MYMPRIVWDCVKISRVSNLFVLLTMSKSNRPIFNYVWMFWMLCVIVAWVHQGCRTDNWLLILARIKVYLPRLPRKLESETWVSFNQRAASRCEDAAHPENKTLLKFHIAAQKPQSLKCCPTPTLMGWKYEAFFFPGVNEGFNYENLWGQQVPASWLNLHVLMMSVRSCMALMKPLQCCNRPISDRLLSQVSCWLLDV